MSMRVQPVQRFTEQEAKAKMGHTVCTLTEFYRVREGTMGHVVGVHKTEQGDFDVVIEWNLPNSEERINYRFAKSTYEKLLSEQ